jgi:hypothetical protein
VERLTEETRPMTIAQLKKGLREIHNLLCMDMEGGGVIGPHSSPNPSLAAVKLERLRNVLEMEGVDDAPAGVSRSPTPARS